MHELRKYYGRITDGNNGVLHYFYDYVYGVIRYATLTFSICTWQKLRIYVNIFAHIAGQQILYDCLIDYSSARNNS